MPILIEHLTELVLACLFVIAVANGVVIALAIARRHRRERHFRRIDALRQQYAPVIAALLARPTEYERSLAVLNGLSVTDRECVLEHVLAGSKAEPFQVPLLRQLCEDLGLVAIWQRKLTGKFDRTSHREGLLAQDRFFWRAGRLGFLLRAKAAENLGIIRHQPSWALLVEALDDPSEDVRSAALWALAAIQEPQSFPALVNRLQSVALNPSSTLSPRALLAALVSFPLNHSAGLMASLNDSNRRLRFMATDVIREMTERQAALEKDFVLGPKIFTPELAELFLTRLCADENPDVRGRAAPVIAYLPDSRSTPALLTLLDDPEWAVRLHTLQALAKRKYLPDAAPIARRLTDSHWMVREGAARVLSASGPEGFDQLCEHFLGTGDRYSREQVADELQRAGLIPTLLTQYAAEADGKPARMIEQLAQMGKTSALIQALGNSSDRNLRKKFIQNFGRQADREIQAWVKQLATQDADAELRALAQAASGMAA